MVLAEEKFRWNEDSRLLQNNNRVILSNKDGAWIKISKQCYDIIDKSIKGEMSESSLLSAFEDKEDSLYFEELLTKLKEMRVIELGNTKKEKTRIEIYLVLTNKCNLQCSHCCISANEDIAEDYFSTTEMFSVIDKILELEPDCITISGGEPLVREDIYEILEYLSSKFKGTVILMTNGILINEGNIHKIIQHVSNIDISIDGVDEESCSLIRGKGVFTKVLETVRLLQENNFHKISLSMVFGSQNLYLLDDFYRLNDEYNTKAVPRTFAAIGRGKEIADKFVKQEDKFTDYEDTTVTNGSIIRDLTVGGCDAIKSGFTIDYTGYIYPCSLLIKDKYILGDIKNIDSLKDWYSNKEFNEENYKNFLQLYPNNHPKCKDCNVNLFCWGCLEVLDRLSDDIVQWDKKCKKNKDILNKLLWS